MSQEPNRHIQTESVQQRSQRLLPRLEKVTDFAPDCSFADWMQQCFQVVYTIPLPQELQDEFFTIKQLGEVYLQKSIERAIIRPRKPQEPQPKEEKQAIHDMNQLCKQAAKWLEKVQPLVDEAAELPPSPTDMSPSVFARISIEKAQAIVDEDRKLGKGLLGRWFG